MQSKLINERQVSLPELSACDSTFLSQNNPCERQKPFLFQVCFLGSMDMYSDVDTVANYLNAHEGWFCRCAQPMKVESLNDNGYILTVGCFSAFGYEVEPKIAVVLNPPVNRVYNMNTIPVPNYTPPGYEVNYQASMELREVTSKNNHKKTLSTHLFSKRKNSNIPPKITQVSWKMNLAVTVIFPKFIYKLSPSLIQSTGDRLLGQIIRQISPRLTYKVQQDFHTRYDLPIPLKSASSLEKIDELQEKYT